MSPGRRQRRSLAGACFGGAVAAGIVVASAQTPPSLRLAGEAPPPASALSLWYRAPASDHPTITIDASAPSGKVSRLLYG
jgi:hypothetical protein